MSGLTSLLKLSPIGAAITNLFGAESAATNICLQSATFSNASWTKNSVTVTANSTLAPNGVTEADTLDATVAGGDANFAVNTAIDGLVRVFSVYLRAGTSSIATVSLQQSGGSVIIAAVNVNLLNGLVTGEQYSDLGVTTGNLLIPASVESILIGAVQWFRVGIPLRNIAARGSITTTCVVNPARNFGGTGTGTVIAWGAQLETLTISPFLPTSQIPTTTVPVTRTAGVLPAWLGGTGVLTGTDIVIGTTVVTGGATTQVLFNLAGVVSSSANLTFNGQTLAVAQGTITTALSPQTWTETRNAAGVTFPGLKYTITDTASAAGSFALQFFGGAAGTTNLLSVDKGGNLTAVGSANISGYASVTVSDYFLSTSNARCFLRANGTVGYVAGVTNDVNLSRISAGLWGAGTGTAGSFAGGLKLTSAIAAGVTVANLNGTPTTGEIQSVTDSLAPVVGAAVAAGGAAKALVWYNGAQWTVIGV